MLAEQSGELLSRTLLCDIANKRGSGIMLCEVVAGCMCFTELFDVADALGHALGRHRN